MSSCVYTSYTGTAFGMVQILPWVVPTAVTLGSFTRDKNGRRGFEFTTFWYSFYLTFCQLILYELQYSFHAMRSDPFCHNVITAAFPSATTFFVTALISFIVLFTFITNMVFDWKYWVYLLCIFIAPPCYLVWLDYNTWWEILVSAALALLANVTYFIVLYKCVVQQMPYLLNSAPCTWFSVTDTYLMTDAQQVEYERLREHYEALDKRLPAVLTALQ